MTKKMMMFVVFLGMCLFLNSSAYANHEGGRKHGYGEKGEGYGQCPIAGKFMKKAHFLLGHQAELGLTEAQVKTIKDLNLQVEKDSIRQKADMKTFMIDLQSKLHEDTVDVAGINALIDESFSSASVDAKRNVEAYASLKAVLTPDQAAKMKELFKAKKARWEGKYEDKHEHRER